MNKYKELDSLIAKELGVDIISRTLGYDSEGNPIELVFNANELSYEWHINGEYIKDVSEELAIQIFQQGLQNLLA